MYSYHFLYTGSDFMAGVGGYLGLFLGLSIFGLVELAETVFKSSKERKKVDERI